MGFMSDSPIRVRTQPYYAVPAAFDATVEIDALDDANDETAVIVRADVFPVGLGVVLLERRPAQCGHLLADDVRPEGLRLADVGGFVNVYVITQLLSPYTEKAQPGQEDSDHVGVAVDEGDPLLWAMRLGLGALGPVEAVPTSSSSRSVMSPTAFAAAVLASCRSDVVVVDAGRSRIWRQLSPSRRSVMACKRRLSKSAYLPMAVVTVTGSSGKWASGSNVRAIHVFEDQRVFRGRIGRVCAAGLAGKWVAGARRLGDMTTTGAHQDAAGATARGWWWWGGAVVRCWM